MYDKIHYNIKKKKKRLVPLGALCLGRELHQVALVVKNPPVNAGNFKVMGSIPWLGKYPGGGRATRSSILAWRIPWAQLPSGLQSIGLQRLGHD